MILSHYTNSSPIPENQFENQNRFFIIEINFVMTITTLYHHNVFFTVLTLCTNCPIFLCNPESTKYEPPLNHIVELHQCRIYHDEFDYVRKINENKTCHTPLVLSFLAIRLILGNSCLNFCSIRGLV